MDDSTTSRMLMEDDHHHHDDEMPWAADHSHSHYEEDDDDDDSGALLSPALAVFLQSLLKDASTVNVVIDNIRGLPEEDAESYMPPPPAPRISDSSVPDLCRHRWGAESYSGVDHARRLTSLSEDGSGSSSHAMDESLDTSLTRAPLVPRRRTSIDSLEGSVDGDGDDAVDDDDDMMWTSDTDDEDEWCTRGCSDDDYDYDDEVDADAVKKPQGGARPPRWQARVAALQGTILTNLEQRDSCREQQNSSTQSLNTALSNHNSNGSNRCLRSPPKAPERQASLRRLECSPSDQLLPTNLSLPNEDQLDCADVQKVARRRHGVSFLHVSSDPLTSMLTSPLEGGGYRPSLLEENPIQVLEKIHREVCISAEDFEEEEEEDVVVDNAKSVAAQQRKSRRRRSSTLEQRRRVSLVPVDEEGNGTTQQGSLNLKQPRNNRDSMPSCAKRRPSPQLDKSSFSDCDSADASPVRAKRRPSPEFESFSSLVDALAKVKQ